MGDHARHGFAFARASSRTDPARRRRREQVHFAEREMNEIVRRYDTPTFRAPDRLSAWLSTRARNYASRNNSMRALARARADLRIRFPGYI